MYYAPPPQIDPRATYTHDLDKIFSRIAGKWSFHAADGLSCLVPKALGEKYLEYINGLFPPKTPPASLVDAPSPENYTKPCARLVLNADLVMSLKITDTLSTPIHKGKLTRIGGDWITGNLINMIERGDFPFHTASRFL
jgi:hypothetical protein